MVGKVRDNTESALVSLDPCFSENHRTCHGRVLRCPSPLCLHRGLVNSRSFAEGCHAYVDGNSVPEDDNGLDKNDSDEADEEN